MLLYFAILFQRNINMAFHSRNFLSFIHGIQNYARPFDEIVYIYDATTTTNNDMNNLCVGSSSTKETVT